MQTLFFVSYYGQGVFKASVMLTIPKGAKSGGKTLLGSWLETLQPRAVSFSTLSIQRGPTELLRLKFGHLAYKLAAAPATNGAAKDVPSK